MHLAGFNGLAQQGVQHDHLVLLLVERPLEPAAIGKAGVLVHGLDGGFLIAPGHRVQNAVLRFIPLLQHGDRDLLLELRLVEIAGIRVELEGQEFLQLLHRDSAAEHRIHHNPQGSIEIAGLQDLHAVVVLLHSGLSGFPQIASDPFAGALGAGAHRPGSNEKDRVFFIGDAEQGKVQLKGTLHQQQGILRGAVQQQLAELLPVELGVQRSPQAVVKLFQPLKGRGDPPGRDILHRCQLCKDLQRIHPHRTPLLFPVIPLVPLCHS